MNVCKKISISGLLLLLVCLFAATAFANDFWVAVLWDLPEKIIERGKLTGTMVFEEEKRGIKSTETQHTCRFNDTVIIVYDKDDDFFFPYIRTRDSSIIFPGQIRVGGSLQQAISSKVIDGEKQPTQTKNGLQEHTWKVVDLSFTLRSAGDTIKEIIVTSGLEHANINWKHVGYLQ